MPDWAKENEVKAGAELIADGGFTCIRDGAVLAVKEDKCGLYVDCENDCHRHYLDGQLDDGEVYIGFTLAAGRVEVVSEIGARANLT